jgi:amiloride-sensitive sodium channel
MWFSFISVGGVVTLIIIFSLWEKFQIHPTITGLDTNYHNWDWPVPTVSLCPTDPVNLSAVREYIEQ